MADGEVNVHDAPSADAMEVDIKPMESIENDANPEDDVEDENEGDVGSDGDEAENSGRPVSNQQYKELKRITDVLINFKIKEHYPSGLFKRLPNKRLLPEYYNVIQRPSAISTLKGKIQRKQYTGIPEFMEDFALIVHNAQVFNRPNSAPVRDVLRLDALFKEELGKLVEQGLIKAEETVYPDLGEIPDATPEPDPVSEDEEDGDEEQDEDDEDEGDESDDDRRKKRGRRARASLGGKKQDKDDDDDNEKAADGDQKRRGRPPKVDTPMEARIKAILKGIRKYKNDKGHTLVYDFEKLPDKAEHPDYYAVILNPVALDGVKKKAKRKKYDNVDQFMKDISLMFNNATTYNEDGSEINTNARELLAEANRLAQIEKDKPDTEYLMQDGRLPLPFINHNGKLWRVGDWILIQNVNDVTKPIPAQIYRTWEDSDKRKWINACWYYRPEQTVHQYEKHFFPNEVVKTGQYRDHSIDEVLDKCFVMFFTRYGKGRPRGMEPSQEVFVCESRYNEEKFKFNKIKTWASCLPDEVRDKDYEMDLFDVPKKVKKIPSPLLYLVDKDAKEDQEIPQPVWGAQNAPPKQGAIYKRPRDENQSPPPEPTPPPPPTPPLVARQPSANLMPQQSSQPGLHRQPSSAGLQPTQMSRPSPSMTPQTPYQAATATPAPQFSRQPYQQPAQQPVYGMDQTPHQNPGPYAQPQTYQSGGYGAAHPGNYGTPNLTQVHQRHAIANLPTPQELGLQRINLPTSQYPPGFEGRTPEVYVLSDAANDALPEAVRKAYPKDDQGRVLFFSQPPLITSTMIEDKVDPRGRGQPLQHTDRYMEKMKERKIAKVKSIKEKLLAKMEREKAEREEAEAKGKHEAETNGEEAAQKQGKAVAIESIALDVAAPESARKDAPVKRMTREECLARIKELKEIDMQRRREAGPITENFWTGYFADDHDPRLPPFH